MSISSSRGVIERVFEVQERRARAYSMLESSFASSDDEMAQRTTVERVTGEFQKLSQEIRDMESTHDDEVIVGILKGIQKEEAEKLRLTVEIHGLKRSGMLDEEGVIGQEHHCQHHDDRVSPHEVKAALAEAYLGLEQCTWNIQEHLEELRYINMDLSQ